MKLSILPIAGLLVLTSCTNTLLENDGTTTDNGRMSFAATAGKTSTRAAAKNPLTSSGDLQTLGTINVSAYALGSTDALMDKAEIKWNSTSWEATATTPFWPSTTVDFYGYANWATAPTIANTGITASVTIGDDNVPATAHTDMMVAAEFDKSKELRTSLYFKHALTQINFKAALFQGTPLQVRIGGLRLVNIASKGNMSYTKANKAQGIVWNQHSNDIKYSIQGLQVNSDTDFANTALAATTPFKVATGVHKTITNNVTGSNSLILIPQIFDGWDNHAGNATASTDVYIEMLAIINEAQHVSGATAGDVNYYYCGKPVAGAGGVNDTYGKVYIPVSSAIDVAGEWQAGKAINYLITFGDTNTGSGGGGFEDNGDPVLVPIKINAVYTDWVNVDVPVLSANIEATSPNITANFVNGYTNLLLSDIATAKSPKIFQGKVTIKGILGETSALQFDESMANGMIGAGSIITYDFKNLTTNNKWGAFDITMTVPAGWEGQHYKNTTAGTVVAAQGTITLNGTVADNFTLTKK